MTVERSRTRSRWPSWFDNSPRPIFVLSSTKRIRYVNSAWEKLTGIKQDEALGMACIRKGPTDKIARTLSLPAGTAATSSYTIRRPGPGHRAGPPWWEITFIPVALDENSFFTVGLIQVVAAEPVGPRVKVPATVMALRSAHASAFTLKHFEGTTPALQQFSAAIRLAAQTTEPIWLYGEAGTGKETLARALHAAGPTRAKAFLGLACDALQPYLLDGLLFGHAGLAESGYLGTLFLKNPEALPPNTQQQLLSWWEQTKHKPRIICGSQNTPGVSVSAFNLHQDFQTDFATLLLQLPPLRERKQDFPSLLQSQGLSCSTKTISLLQAYSWPGNYREWKTTLQEAQLASGGKEITPEQLPLYLRERAAIELDPPPKRDKEPTLDESLEAVERRLIMLSLMKTEGNTTKAATRLGIPRARLLRRMESLKIPLREGTA